MFNGICFFIIVGCGFYGYSLIQQIKEDEKEIEELGKE